jgi:hypothetical protein
MPRTSSFDDPSVGRGLGEYFKFTGTKERPQRIAYIPGEALPPELIVTDTLRKKAAAGDKEAFEKIEEITNLSEIINRSLKKNPPGAEIWTNENGQRCMLYARAEAASVFWIDNVGYIYDKPDIPAECKGERGVSQLYGFVVLEYELGDDGVRILNEDQQLELGDGHKLRFRYSLRIAQMNDSKVRAWKEHSRNFPFITCDYEVWTETSGAFKKTKFSPCPNALWRENPAVMKRIIAEARKIYPNVRKNLAKDYSRDEVIKMFPELERKYPTAASSAPSMGHPEIQVEETDFSKLLGVSPDSGPT